jgi:hypothetical protein
VAVDVIESLRLIPSPGTGLLARLPGIVLLALPTNDAESAAPLLDACRQAGASADDPARALARRLAGLLSSDEGALPPFCTIADADAEGRRGLAVVAHGPIEVSFQIGREEEVVSGAQSLTWVDRIIDGPVDVVRAGPRSALPDVRSLRLDTDVTSGVVPAGGFVLVPTEPSNVDPPRPALALGDAGSFKSVLLTEVATSATRDPLPLASELADQASVVVPDDRIVQGIRCSRGHFTDPANLYCAICGISMAQHTQILVDGIRPTLGFVVMDDASTYGLDRDYVVGREPLHDPRVANAAARALVLDDAGHTVSRVHAEIRLEGWHVRLLDRGSTNGTFVWDDAARTWRRIDSGQSERIRPGMRFAFGQRTARYESPHDHRHT